MIVNTFVSTVHMATQHHHGDLRNALFEDAFELFEEEGAENFSLRAAARRAGVSSGAPIVTSPIKMI